MRPAYAHEFRVLESGNVPKTPETSEWLSKFNWTEKAIQEMYEIVSLTFSVSQEIWKCYKLITFTMFSKNHTKKKNFLLTVLYLIKLNLFKPLKKMNKFKM